MAQLDHDDFLEKSNEYDPSFIQAEADLRSGKNKKDFKACSSIFHGMDIKEKQFLVGDVFMRKYYTIFDRD
jgi:hypothetical protein